MEDIHALLAIGRRQPIGTATILLIAAAFEGGFGLAVRDSVPDDGIGQIILPIMAKALGAAGVACCIMAVTILLLDRRRT